MVSHIFISDFHILQFFLLVSFLLNLLIFHLLLQRFQLILFLSVFLLEFRVIIQKILQYIFMDFILSDMNMLAMDNRFMAVLHKHIQIQKLLIWYFGEFFLNFGKIFFDDVIMYMFACISLDSKIACKFKFNHLLCF